MLPVFIKAWNLFFNNMQRKGFFHYAVQRIHAEQVVQNNAEIVGGFAFFVFRIAHFIRKLIVFND